MEDRSLDDFLDGTNGNASDDSETGDDPSDEPTPESHATDDPNTAADESEQATSDPKPAPGPDVDPAATTYAWDPDGGTCAACGATAERRWSGEDGLVCSDCTEW